jgi:hypothetical protein
MASAHAADAPPSMARAKLTFWRIDKSMITPIIRIAQIR